MKSKKALWKMRQRNARLWLPNYKGKEVKIVIYHKLAFYDSYKKGTF